MRLTNVVDSERLNPLDFLLRVRAPRPRVRRLVRVAVLTIPVLGLILIPTLHGFRLLLAVGAALLGLGAGLVQSSSVW